MSVVKIDSRGRFTIPKEIGVREGTAVVIPAGSFFVVIPLPSKRSEKASKWLLSKRSASELKDLAERLGRKDAVKRARRRGQI